MNQPSSIEDLWNELERIVRSISRRMLNSVIENFEKRLRHVIVMEGGKHIENAFE